MKAYRGDDIMAFKMNRKYSYRRRSVSKLVETIVLSAINIKLELSQIYASRWDFTLNHFVVSPLNADIFL